MKTSKLTLSELKVQSFTTLDSKPLKQIKAGGTLVINQCSNIECNKID